MSAVRLFAFVVFSHRDVGFGPILFSSLLETVVYGKRMKVSPSLPPCAIFAYVRACLEGKRDIGGYGN
jgi:hypothetical protein